jgi:thiamine biosynthesis lipoprotein
MRFLVLILFCISAGAAPAQPRRFQFMEPKMGSPLHLVFYAGDSLKATALARQAFLLVDSLNRIYSDYDPDSELSRLNRTAGTGQFVPVSPALYALLGQSRIAWAASSSTFDITMGPLSWLWRKSRKEGRLPEDSAVQQARYKTGFRYVLFDTAAHRIQLFQKGMRLDLGGIAKGHVAQVVVDFLYSSGITAALADAGGDIACSGAPPGKSGWTVGINVPEQENELLNKTLEIENGAVATSGDVYQFTEHKGRRYSHILNPATGLGVTYQRNVTIVAPDGATADWLATACSILPVRKAKKLTRQYNAALLIGVLKNGKIKFYKTKSLGQYLRAAE